MSDPSLQEAFAAGWPVLVVTHLVADFGPGQTDWQADHKARRADHPHRDGGWTANLLHVGQYHLVFAAIAVPMWVVLGLPWTAQSVTAAAVLSVVSHAVLDRRWIVVALLIALRKRNFALSPSGEYRPGVQIADQVCHVVVMTVNALLIASS